jgi:hypothetical protein
LPVRSRAVLLTLTLVLGALLAAAPVSAAGEKVAIIVGPVGGLTGSYRTWADEVASAATAAGATVAKAYSPDATWANVLAAVEGANVIVYFGHGNGFPNPYGASELPDRTNGWGLNTSTGNGDADSWSAGTLVYCGEKALLGTLSASDGAAQRTHCSGGPIRPAPGFVMVYAQAHYAPGFGERYVASTPLTTESEAQQRVRHYSYPVLALGASAYFATAYGDADEIVSRVLTQPNTAYADLFRAGRGFSAGALRAMSHPDVSGAEVWVQQTVIAGFHFGEPDYWYAFAGNPSRTRGGGTAPSAVSRIWGPDRYSTAAALSAAAYAPGVPVAYVATGLIFPDALAGGVAAGRGAGPVLLVRPDAIPAATHTELARLKPGRIVVLGGPASVGDEVAVGLGRYTSGGVTRLWGHDRYATAAAISAASFASASTVYVATGLVFPDSLAAGPVAGRGPGPVLLVPPTSLPPAVAAELRRLNPAQVVVVGGAGSVSDEVLAAIRAIWQ